MSKMKTLISTIILTIVTLSSYSQYSQNIDSLSRKEIRKLLTSKDYTGEIKNSMRLHKITKEMAIAGYTIAGSIFLISSLVNSISTTDETNQTTPLIIFATSLTMTIVSEIAYSKSVKLYSRKRLNLRQVHYNHRNDWHILKFLAN